MLGLGRLWGKSTGDKGGLTARVARTNLRINVTERGNLESCKTIDGVNELSSREGKIIQLVPEGTRVKKGDVVCTFDNSEIEKSIKEQEIKVKQAESKIETTAQEVEIAKSKGQSEILDAEVELKLSKLDQEKYQEGDYLVERADITGAIALAKKDLEDATEKREQFRALVKKGFRSPEQLRSVEQEYSKTLNYLERDQEKLRVKEKFEYPRKMVEMTAKIQQSTTKVGRAQATAKAELAKANAEHEAAKATHRIEQEQLEKYHKEKEKCVLKAEQEGIVAYANDRWWDESSRIREGASVYPRQKIFTLPDMSNMQVKVNIHESQVKKVKEGQKVEIRVDASSNLVIIGTVKTVSQLADSTSSRFNGGAKEYPCVIAIDTMPAEDLKPAMTAEVKILVGELPGVLAVPVQAVVERQGTHYAYVRGPEGPTRKTVKVGSTNEKFIEVTEGLSEGDDVFLDAQTRIDDEMGKSEDAAAPAPADAKAPGA